MSFVTTSHSFCVIIFLLPAVRTIHLLYVMLLIFTTISCSMRIDGQTDVTKLIVSFSNFANTPKNISFAMSGGLLPQRSGGCHCSRVLCGTG